MPNPFDFLTRPLIGLGRKIGQGVSTGVHQLGQYGDEDENDAELSQVRKYLPPGFNGRPNPARQPRPTNGAGNLSQAAGIPDESRAGNYASALGIPDTGGGVLMPANPRPAMSRVAPQNDGVRMRPWDAPNEDVPQGQTGPVLIRRPGSGADEELPAAPPVSARPVMPSSIPGGDPGQYAPQRPAIAPPQKTYGHQRLDYRDEHGKRGFKEILKSGLAGMAMTGGQGGLGGLIGGFGAGALGQAIAPQQMAEARFAMGPGRKILADQQMQHDDELYGLKVRGQEAQIAENEAQTARYRRPEYSSAAWGTFNKATGEAGYTRPAPPTVPPAISPVTLDVNGVPTVVDGRTGKPLGRAYIKPVNERSATPGERRLQVNDSAKAKALRDAQADPEWGLRYLPAEERDMLAKNMKLTQATDPQTGHPAYDEKGQPVMVKKPLTPAERNAILQRLEAAKKAEVEQRAAYYQQNPDEDNNAPSSKRPARPGTTARKLSDIRSKYGL